MQLTAMTWQEKAETNSTTVEKGFIITDNNAVSRDDR